MCLCFLAWRFGIIREIRYISGRLSFFDNVCNAANLKICSRQIILSVMIKS